ncbi:MAG: RimK/LysX family protein [Desulfomonile sp.]|nr:RimK/LysX family protein [Desulfomonile sp.]
MKGWIALMIGTLVGFITTSAVAEEKQIVGWVEKVRVFPGNVLLEAKVDTGADHSSIHAFDITEFSRDGNRWVRFCIGSPDGKKDICELQLIRTAKIKRHGAPRLERHVVVLGVCLGAFYKEAEFSLQDRSRFKYPVLLGRSFMEGRIIVDPGRTYLTEPDCKEAPTR